MMLTIDKEQIVKFDIPGPRYTSYPTAPAWSDKVTESKYVKKLKIFGQTNKTLSLYIHIPFCESMCTYCACSVVIRKNDAKYSDEYLDYLCKEIDLVAESIGERKTIKQLHWGGGTPTFLNERQIKRLFAYLETKFNIDYNDEIAIEIDPRTVNYQSLKNLRDLGFNRVSLGVQDFDTDVQESINRVQSYEMVTETFKWCKELKFLSINFDLIYGLPRQTLNSFTDTVAKVIELKPDRIALYSFAYVPWLKKHQNKIDLKTLPSNETKLKIFLNSSDQLIAEGYQSIAMDHFALITDEMAIAFNKGELYRNFMGYTIKPADEYIGLGVTSIGFLENTFIQNHKALGEYYRLLDENKLPIDRGKELNKDDKIRQWTINALMCHLSLNKSKFCELFGISFDDYFNNERIQIEECANSELICINETSIRVTELGKVFIRNICMIFDQYLKQSSATQKFFSQTV